MSEMKSKRAQIIVIGILLIVIVAVGALLYFVSFKDFWTTETCSEECQHRGFASGECKLPSEEFISDIEIGRCEENKICFCSEEQLIGECADVAPQHIQECCENWRRENNFFVVPCLGHWEIKEGNCSWVCG